MIMSLYFNYPYSLIICFLIFSTFVEYELNIKYYQTSFLIKIICLLIDIVHVFIFVISLYLIVTSKDNLKKIVILDTIFLMLILSFFHFKMCVLTLIQNKLIKKNIEWTGPLQRIAYFFDKNHPYLEINPTMDKWIDSNKISCFFIILANLNCLSMV